MRCAVAWFGGSSRVRTRADRPAARLTVNTVTLTAFGGLTEYEGDPRSPLAQGLIPFAGPFTSALLAVILLAARLSVGGNDVDPGLAGVLTFGVGTNVMITVVNLLPFPTLEGGQIAGSIWRGLSGRRERALRGARLRKRVSRRR
jgi:Zn-dependent protease